jgi:hypothetical protein
VESLSVRENFGRYSNHCTACRRFFEDNGTGTHDGILADHPAGEHDGADPDVREQANAYSPAQDNARRDMDVCLDSAIVLDYRAAVNNAIFADHRPRIDDHSWHHDSARSDARRRCNDSCWVNESCGRKPISERAAEAPSTCPVITYGNDEGVSGKAMQLLMPTHQQAVAKCEIGFRRIVVQECNAFEMSGAPGCIQNDLSVASSAPNQ